MHAKVFITGLPGLLGFNLARYMALEGFEVTTYGRNPMPLSTDFKHQHVLGDIMEGEKLMKAMEGQDIVVHAAAITDHISVIGPDSRNAMMTKAMLEAARACKIKRFIYISSASTIGFGDIELPGNEEAPFKGEFYGSTYINSKFEAEQLVLKACAEGFPAIILNPTFIIGPYDFNFSSGKLLLTGLKSKVLFYTGGGKNFVFVRDLCVAIHHAFELGQIGERYILGGENLSFKEFFGIVREVAGKPERMIKMPDRLILLFGCLQEKLFQLFGRRPILDVPAAKIALDGHYFDASKAIKELNMPQTPIKKAIRDTYDWLKATGNV